MASWLMRAGRQTLVLNGQRLRLRSLSSAAAAAAAKSSSTEDEVKSLASYVTTKIDEIVRYGDPPLPLLYAAELYMGNYLGSCSPGHICWPSSMLLVTDLTKNFPELRVDPIQIYHTITFCESVLYYDDIYDEDKEMIERRVLGVVESYPKVGNYKVSNETHFVEDLGFGKWDCIDVLEALKVTFKLYIPDDIVSCKLAIEYICDHIKERLSAEEFQEHLYLTGEFGESKSEFRKIFVPPNVDTSTYYTKLEPLDESAMLSLKGLKLNQFFWSMKGTTLLVESPDPLKPL